MLFNVWVALPNPMLSRYSFGFNRIGPVVQFLACRWTLICEIQGCEGQGRFSKERPRQSDSPEGSDVLHRNHWGVIRCMCQMCLSSVRGPWTLVCIVLSLLQKGRFGPINCDSVGCVNTLDRVVRCLSVCQKT